MSYKNDTPTNEVKTSKLQTEDANTKKKPNHTKPECEVQFSLRFLDLAMHLLFRLSVSFLVFYFLGSFNRFLDSNLIFILKSLQVVSTLSTTVAGLVFVIQLFFRLYYKKTFPKKQIIKVFGIFILSFLFLVFSTIIIVISKM